MKNIYFFAAFLITAATMAQIPAGYYNTATGTGYTLKTQLKRIINDVDDPQIVGANEHIATDEGYNALDDLYPSSDRDLYYENDNSVLDMYSENPSGNDPYNYSYGSDECGNYDSEGDCFNKEHVIPQSAFGDASPMRNDGHQVIPTDGRVNGFRGNYPFGVVGTLISQSGITNPTLNGSKLGNNLNSGYSAGYTDVVFEPIDEFKGDIARIYFYFATRYEDQLASWSAYDMFDGSSDKVLADPFLNILMTWHQNDPVSQREIDRNNVVYNHQNNRNPYVDHPEYVQQIWNPAPDTEAPSVPINLVVTNEASTSISLSWTASIDNVGVTSYDIYVDGTYDSNSTTNSATVINLTPETTYTFTVLAKDAANNMSAQSAPVDGTTTEAGSSGSECAAENFENIPADDSAYTDRTWTGNNGTWNATRARTDQVINNRAILIDCRTTIAGTVTSSTVAGGIGNLTVTTQRIFTGTDGTLDVLVNGTTVGSIPYTDAVVTTTISNINIEGNITVTVQDNDSGSARIGIDDLSWTCYTDLGIDDNPLSSVKIYPNPANNRLQIDLNSATETKIEIYSVLGKKVYHKTIQNSQEIQLDGLSSGIYILRLTQDNQSISKKLIKE